MDIKGSSSICRTCRKEVLVDNLALHESHCGRFLCLCPDCGETVSREQLEQHRLEEHSQVPIFTKKSNTAAAARAREGAWQEIAEQVNA
ncbi:unnamed protein product [Boreogadus saida]